MLYLELCQARRWKIVQKNQRTKKMRQILRICSILLKNFERLLKTLFCCTYRSLAMASTLFLIDEGNASPISPSIHNAFDLIFTESADNNDSTYGICSSYTLLFFVSALRLLYNSESVIIFRYSNLHKCQMEMS